MRPCRQNLKVYPQGDTIFSLTSVVTENNSHVIREFVFVSILLSFFLFLSAFGEVSGQKLVGSYIITFPAVLSAIILGWTWYELSYVKCVLLVSGELYFHGVRFLEALRQKVHTGFGMS